MFLLSLSTAVIAQTPTLTTDKPKYEPGETITFKGVEWVPGETVTIVVSADSIDGAMTIKATADRDGAFNVTAPMPDDGEVSASAIGAGSDGVTISGNSSAYLTVYAPGTSVTISGGSPVFGALLGRTLTISGNSQVHYDVQLPQIWSGFGF